MSMESTPGGEVSPRADLVSALVWTAIGAAITVGAWNMDRLERLNINKFEAPGLVPGLLGFAVFVLGLVLAVRALRQGALLSRPAGPGIKGQGRTLLVFVATVGYAVILVGHGIPFWLATFLFVTAFIFFFDRERQSGLGRSTARQAALALVCGAVTSAVVTYAFQEIFYVRLP